MSKILVIEDDKSITELLNYNLKKNHFFVEIAYDGATGLQKAFDHKPDLIVLDLMLPQMNGIEICRRLKSSSNANQIPVLILTAKSEDIDRIVGLELGADDYVTKPFNIRELILRIKAILKRTDMTFPGSKEIQLPDLYIDSEKHIVMVHKKNIELTRLEYNLLMALIQSDGRVLTRDMLLNKVWGYDYYGDTRTVDVHIRRLRQKLGRAAHYIGTIRGTGYKFNIKVE